MTQYAYLVPHWFFGFDIGMNLLFAIVGLLVSFYSYKVYQVSEQRGSKLFSISFLLIALSYILKAGFNLFILKEASDGMRGVEFANLSRIGLMGFNSYILLFVLGLVTLTYMSFKIKNWRAYLALVLVSLSVLFISLDRAVTFTILSSAFLLYICVHYVSEYYQNRDKRTLLVLLAFALLFLTGVEILFMNVTSMKFVVAQIFELGSYILIFISLLLTIRKKK
jgi:hypothetical protein